MEKKEKADFLLEQLRLCLAQKDFIRTEIVSRKVNSKTLALEGFEVCSGGLRAFMCPRAQLPFRVADIACRACESSSTT